MSKDNTLVWLVGLGAAAGLGYYFFVVKPKAALAATPQPAPSPPVLPQGSIPVISQPQQPSGISIGSWGLPPIQSPSAAQLQAAANVASQGIPTNLVTLTQSVEGLDLTTGMSRSFGPGEIVDIYGTPVGGVTTFTNTDSVPLHYYTTQSVVAGLFHG